MSGSDVSPALSLRLVLAGAWRVIRGRSLRAWPRLLALLDLVGVAAPDAIDAGHRQRLRMGLRAAVITGMIRDSCPAPVVLDTLDWLFPEGVGPELGHTHRPSSQHCLEAEENFRNEVVGILEKGRGHSQELEDYGEPFLESLEQLFFEFLQRLESALPPPDLSELTALALSHAPPGRHAHNLPFLQRYLADMGHAHWESEPRPPRRAQPKPARPRPHRRRLRPLHPAPYAAPANQARPEPGSAARTTKRRHVLAGGGACCAAIGPPTGSESSAILSVAKDGQTQRGWAGGATSASGLRLRSRRGLHDAHQSEDPDGEGDRDRHRAHGQGGADQGAGGGEGGDPPPAATAHLQRETDER